jgi:hypothetical protein
MTSRPKLRSLGVAAATLSIGAAGPAVAGDAASTNAEPSFENPLRIPELFIGERGHDGVRFDWTSRPGLHSSATARDRDRGVNGTHLGPSWRVKWIGYGSVDDLPSIVEAADHQRLHQRERRSNRPVRRPCRPRPQARRNDLHRATWPRSVDYGVARCLAQLQAANEARRRSRCRYLRGAMVAEFAFGVASMCSVGHSTDANGDRRGWRRGVRESPVRYP